MARVHLPALPAWARRTHPLVRYESRHWARSRAWRLARNVMRGGSLLFILAPAACAVLFRLQSRFNSPAEAILALGGTFSLGVALLSSLAVWFTNISASILGATLIARERESQTWPFLRLTNLTALDIVGGKLMALFYVLVGSLELIAGLRLLALAAALATAILAYLASGLNAREFAASFVPLLDELGLTSTQWQALALFVALAALWAAISWLAEPFFGVFYNGVLGLTMSTLARSRGAAVVLVFAAHFCLALGLYAPASQLSALFLAPLAAAGNQMAALRFVALNLALQFTLQTLLPWAVMAASMVFALKRVELLSD